MNRRDFLSSLFSLGLSAVSVRAGAKGLTSDDNVRFLYSTDTDYETYRAVFNARIDHRPVVISVCRNEAGVQKAVRHAHALGLAATVKGGGHHFEGYCSSDGGMTIDLTLMNGQRMGENGRLISEPARRLVEVYENLIPQGRLLPTGSCAMVGLGGITLGGGYGLFSREHGLTCDWLRRVRLVDGHGKVHEVHEGNELLWALRGGGGGGLGVVTELEFDTVACPRSIWSHRFKSYKLTPAQVSAKTRAWFGIAEKLPRHAFSAYVLSGTTLTILVTSSLAKADADLLTSLKAFSAMSETTAAGQESPLPAGIRRYYGKLAPLPFRNASAGYYRGYSDIEAVIPDISVIVARHPRLLMQINTLGGAIDDPVATNHSVYAHRGYPFLGEIQSYWENPARAPALVAAVAQVQSLFAQAGITRHYANYADGGLKNWSRAYYGLDGYKRLQAVKRLIDPENIFRHPQSIDPRG